MHKRYTSLFVSTALLAGVTASAYGGELDSSVSYTEFETYGIDPVYEPTSEVFIEPETTVPTEGELPGETIPDPGTVIEPVTEAGEVETDLTIDDLDITEPVSESGNTTEIEPYTEEPEPEIIIDTPESETHTDPVTERETRKPEKETYSEGSGDESDEILIDESELPGLLETELDTELLEMETEAESETETETDLELEIDYSISGIVTDAGLGELFLAVSGYPVGDLTANEAQVYHFLRNTMMLNKSAACGVLANIYCESNFSTIAIGDGGTSLGLCQWHAGRCRALIGWCEANGYDYRSVEGQLNYLRQELTTGYAGVYEYLLSCPESVQGAYQAAYYFCMYFESPDSVQMRSDARGQIAASSYYPADLDEFMLKQLSISGDITKLSPEEAARRGLDTNGNRLSGSETKKLDEKTLRMIRDLDRRLGVRRKDERLSAAVNELFYSLTYIPI